MMKEKENRKETKCGKENCNLNIYFCAKTIRAIFQYFFSSELFWLIRCKGEKLDEESWQQLQVALFRMNVSVGICCRLCHPLQKSLPVVIAPVVVESIVASELFPLRGGSIRRIEKAPGRRRKRRAPKSLSIKKKKKIRVVRLCLCVSSFF